MIYTERIVSNKKGSVKPPFSCDVMQRIFKTLLLFECKRVCKYIMYTSNTKNSLFVFVFDYNVKKTNKTTVN